MKVKKRSNSILKNVLCAIFVAFVAHFFILSFHSLTNQSTAVTDAITNSVYDYDQLEQAKTITKKADTTLATNYTSETPVITAKPSSYYTNTATFASATVTPTYNNITIGGRTLPITTVSDTRVDAGAGVNFLAGYNFLYGHNSYKVFSHLASLPAGTRFTVTLNGSTTTYRIATTVTLEKAVVNTLMNSIVKARLSGVQYSLSIMTCAGQSLGGGDATHRTIVYAVAE